MKLTVRDLEAETAKEKGDARSIRITAGKGLQRKARSVLAVRVDGLGA